MAWTAEELLTPASISLTKKWLIRHYRACHAFFECIPEEARTVASRAHYRQWHVLQTLNRVGSYVYDLFNSNYALAWILSSLWVFHPATQPMRTARSLVKRKQRYILGFLDFPSTDAAVRIFRRIEPHALDIRTMLWLREGLKEPFIFKQLQHQRRINYAVLFLLLVPSFRRLVSQSFLDEISKANMRYPDELAMFEDIMRLNREMDYAFRIPLIRNAGKLQEIHNRLVTEYNAMRVREYDLVVDPVTGVHEYARKKPKAAHHRIFPSPPLPGAETIIPITTEDELIKEGMEQNHCVASYAGIVAQGGMYLYRILSPERATLAVQRRGYKWNILDIRGFANKKVSEKTYALLEAWVRGYNLNAE